MKHKFMVLALLLAPLATAEETKPNIPVPKTDPAAPDVPSKPSTPAFKDKKEKKAEKRHEFLALKNANSAFLRSPQGITFNKQIAALEQELNAIYEKYLNVFHQSQMRAERDHQIHLLKEKIATAESDYETLRDSSLVYHDMVKAFEKNKHAKITLPEKTDEAK